MSNSKAYMVAAISDIYMFPVSKIYKTEKAVVEAYKKEFEETGDKNLKIIKAQWVEADFDEYHQTRAILEQEE